MNLSTQSLTALYSLGNPPLLFGSDAQYVCSIALNSPFALSNDWSLIVNISSDSFDIISSFRCTKKPGKSGPLAQLPWFNFHTIVRDTTVNIVYPRELSKRLISFTGASLQNSSMFLYFPFNNFALAGSNCSFIIPFS